LAVSTHGLAYASDAKAEVPVFAGFLREAAAPGVSIFSSAAKKIAVELTQSLRKSVTVDWAVRETVRARLRVMVKTLLKRYKYPPDRQEEATETVLKQAESLSAEWVPA
jgi:hypothetical protein